MQELRYTQSEAGELPAWRVLAEFADLADMRTGGRALQEEQGTEADGWEGIE